MYSRNLKSMCLALALACMALAPAVLSAQGSVKPAPKAAPSDYTSRWDIFAGYSYLGPKGTVQVPQPNGTVAPYSYNAVNLGGLFSGAYYFNKYVGAQVEYGIHEWGKEKAGSNVGDHGNNDGFQTISTGLIVRYPTGDITPFAHALVGGARIDGPDHNPKTWGPDLTVGGGLDYETPLLNHRLAIRLFQVDYEYMHANFGPDKVYGGRANINAARLSTGVVLHVGSIAPPAPPTIACSASPASVFPGEKVTLTSTPSGLNPKEHAVYTWSGDGVSGSETTTTVDTISLAPGTYTVKCGVKEGKPGKEGLKPWQLADASTTYTVKEFEPPTVSCSASPTTIKPGESATISATGMSPQNRPLTYSYTANAGTVSGSGSTANYSSTGAPTGAVGITCKVADDKGHSATSNTSLEIVAPPPPPGPSPEQVRLEARLALHSIFFPTAQPTAAKPEGGLLESQEGTLNTLATDFKHYLEFKPDAHLILTGHADVRGSVAYNQALTERRVNRAKEYLVQNGVPAASIETRAVGKDSELSDDQVKSLIEQNSELTDAAKAKTLKHLKVIVLAQNRRVDISLSSTGQQSVQLYPFNAADSATLLDEKAFAAKKKAAAKKQ